MTLIDTHAHIYPDAIAAKAARSIGTFYDMPVGMNGTVDSLLAHGTAAGISRFLVQSVAVTWERAHAINDFIARSVAEHPDRFIGFGAIHPAHPDIDAELDRIMAYGFKGIKLHPDIQQFCMDDPAAIRLLEAMLGTSGIRTVSRSGLHVRWIMCRVCGRSVRTWAVGLFGATHGRFWPVEAMYGWTPRRVSLRSPPMKR